MNLKRLAIPVLVVGALAAGFQLSSMLLDRARDNHSLMVSGNIEAHESVVSFKSVQSRIVELPFDEGQWVRKGTLLARLEDSDYRQNVKVAEAALGQNEQQLAVATANADAATKMVLNDEADLAQKTIDFKRYQRLWDNGVVSAEQRDLAETAFKQSSAALMRDRALLVAARKNIGAAQAAVRNATENLKLAGIVLGYTVLTAPFDGVIIARQAELGEVMIPSAPVVTLADLDHVWMRAYIGETDLGRIRWGQSAVLRTDTYPGKSYPGRISFIASQAEFTPKSVETHKERVTLVYRIKIDADNPNHELKPGMPVDATIDLTPSQAPTQPQSNGGIGQRD